MKTKQGVRFVIIMIMGFGLYCQPQCVQAADNSTGIAGQFPDSSSTGSTYNTDPPVSENNLRQPMNDRGTAPANFKKSHTKQNKHAKKKHNLSVVGSTTGAADRASKESVGATGKVAKTGFGMTDRAAKTTIGIPAKGVKEVFKTIF